MELTVLLILIGFGVAFLSGLLGLGGAILLIPALMFIPPAVGLSPLDMKTIAGITVMQVLFASWVSLWKHREHGFVNRRLVLIMGSCIVVGSLVGSLFSKVVSSEILELIFAVLALIAGGMMFLPLPQDQESSPIESLKFSGFLAGAVALVLGVLNGMIGAAGAFILIPMMVYLLKVPLRTAIGSSFGIVFLSALAAAAGKITTGQVDFPLAAAAISGSLAGAWWGSVLSKQVHLHFLKYGLAVLVTGIGIRTFWQVIL